MILYQKYYIIIRIIKVILPESQKDPLKSYFQRKTSAFFTRDGEQEYFRRLNDPSYDPVEIRREILEANQGLVVKLAKKYARGRETLLLIDLIQEGNIGLMKAFEKFDPSRGIRFYTYAKWWIEGGIQQAIFHKDLNIRIPIKKVKLLRRLRKARQKMLFMIEFETLDEEYDFLAQELEISREKLIDLFAIERGKVRSSRVITEEGDEIDMWDLDPSEPEDELEIDSDREWAKKQVRLLLSKIPSERNRWIVWARLVEEKEYGEIGEELGISKQAVAQQFKRIMDKLLKRFTGIDKIDEAILGASPDESIVGFIPPSKPKKVSKPGL